MFTTGRVHKALLAAIAALQGEYKFQLYQLLLFLLLEKKEGDGQNEEVTYTRYTPLVHMYMY